MSATHSRQLQVNGQASDATQVMAAPLPTLNSFYLFFSPCVLSSNGCRLCPPVHTQASPWGGVYIFLQGATIFLCLDTG